MKKKKANESEVEWEQAVTYRLPWPMGGQAWSECCPAARVLKWHRATDSESQVILSELVSASYKSSLRYASPSPPFSQSVTSNFHR